MENNATTPTFSFDELIIWDSGFGYEIGNFLSEGYHYDTYLVNLKTAVVREPCSYPKSEIHKYSDKLIEELTKKYGYEKRYLYATLNVENAKTHTIIYNGSLPNNLHEINLSKSNKVPIKRGCQNKECFCTGKCNEIIGWRDKLPNEL